MISSPQTDSSREKSIELQIQARVAQELERLRAREQQTLEEIEKRLAEIKESSSGSTKSLAAVVSAPGDSGYSQGSLDLDAPRIPFAGRESYVASSALSSPQPSQQQQPAGQPESRDLSRQSLSAEIEQLRSKLDGRKRLVTLDEGVERAKQSVVTCLRLNDRRPLDCWKEVEQFKQEVARLEAAFVDKVVG